MAKFMSCMCMQHPRYERTRLKKKSDFLFGMYACICVTGGRHGDVVSFY